MLKELLKNTSFLSKIKRFYEENKEEIVDIILFGSAVRGKERPADIDILIIYKIKDNLDLNYKLKKQFNNLNLQIISKTYQELFKPTFIAREAILSEGYSLVNKLFISEGLGYSNEVLFKYELKKLNKSERMRFYYALYGRNNSIGMLRRLNAKKFADTILLCPIINSERMKEFLDEWNIPYLEIPSLIPMRLLNILK